MRNRTAFPDRVLYNEIEPYPVAWLGNLVNAGHIAPGRVDARSIRDLRAADVAHATQAHFFAGIGVWSYALRLAGWPDDEPVWTGSCPCQPFSDAGKGLGFADERHLWPDWFRLIEECRPPILFGEQVASRDGYAWLDLVQADLEGAGYAVGAAVLPAAGVGAPHGRHRIFFGAVRVADADATRCWGVEEPVRQPEAGEPRGARRLGEAGERRDDANGRRDSGDLAHTRRSGLSDAEPAHLRGEGRREERRAVEQRRVPPARRVAVAGGEGWREVGADAQGGGGGSGAQGVGKRPGDRRPWDDPEWLHCRDGKWRPTQPGLRPLVDRLAPGVAGVRAGSLKGYGNAIVPQAASAFIRAFVSAVVDTTPRPE